jgi:hypothetical protein
MKSMGTQRSIALEHSASATQAWHVETLDGVYVRHMCVDTSQPCIGPVQSALVSHCTQVPALHTGVADRCAHCVLIVHG